MSFEVLFVCTGNVCRSPSAELVCTALLAPGADVVARSAGTHALVGEPIDGPTATELARFGLDPTQHRGTQFATSMALDADLVLTAAREHRDFVITASPSVHRRVFTMKEFTRLVHDIPPGMAPPDVVVGANAHRPVVGQVPAAEDDIRDPFHRDPETARDVLDQIGTAVAEVLRSLGLIRTHSPSGTGA